MNSRMMAVTLAVLAALSVLYVVSVGPVLWLAAHGYLPVWVARIYDPIWTMPVVKDFIEWEISHMP